MEFISHLILRFWEFFWSLWPKNFIFLVLISALSEVTSVTVFKLSGNRGLLAVVGYILGFFVVAFYAEALKYSKVSHSYPIWLVTIAILITLSSIFVLKERVPVQWFIGFILAVSGVIIIQNSLTPD